MKEIKQNWRKVVCNFKQMSNADKPIQVTKYYLNALDGMVNDSVKNFKMRVQNLWLEQDIEEAL